MILFTIIGGAQMRCCRAAHFAPRVLKSLFLQRTAVLFHLCYSAVRILVPLLSIWLFILSHMKAEGIPNFVQNH